MQMCGFSFIRSCGVTFHNKEVLVKFLIVAWSRHNFTKILRLHVSVEKQSFLNAIKVNEQNNWKQKFEASFYGSFYAMKLMLWTSVRPWQGLRFEWNFALMYIGCHLILLPSSTFCGLLSHSGMVDR